MWGRDLDGNQIVERTSVSDQFLLLLPTHLHASQTREEKDKETLEENIEEKENNYENFTDHEGMEKRTKGNVLDTQESLERLGKERE